MSETLFIDVWSDVVCPFCYLGTRQLAKALENFEHRDDVVVRHRAFELDPGATADPGVALPELLAKKYSMPVEKARSLNERLEHEAADLGMNWKLANARPGNTFDAHRLIALAASQNKSAEMNERLFRAYFSEGLLLSDHGVLESLAGDIGILDTSSLWVSPLFVDEVRHDENQAGELGISGVPSLLIDGKFMVVGAQGSDHLLSVLQRAWARRTAA